MKELIIRHTEHRGDEDTINAPMTLERLREIYGKDFRDNIRNLQRGKADRFCVTQAGFNFERDPELRLFKLVQGNNGQTEIIYLGKGFDRAITIANWYAAETWGYSVIRLPNYKPLVPQSLPSDNKTDLIKTRYRRPYR